MLRVADGRRCDAVALLQGDEQLQRFDRLHLTQTVARVERQNAAMWPLDGQLCFWIDEALADPLKIDVEPGDAVGGSAVHVRIDQRVGKNLRILVLRRRRFGQVECNLPQVRRLEIVSWLDCSADLLCAAI